jgi:hypothetical protein
MFVYKHYSMDPCLEALKYWLPRFDFLVCFLGFQPHERKRGEHLENQRISERLRETVQRFQPTHLLAWVSYLNLAEVRWLKSIGVKVSMALNGVASFSSWTVPDQREYFELLRELDQYFIPHAPHVPILREHGIRAYEMPFFYDPATYKPLPAWKRPWGSAILQDLHNYRAKKWLGIWRRLRRIGTPQVILIGNFGPEGNPQRAYRRDLVGALGQQFRMLLLSNLRVDVPGIQWLGTITHSPALNWLMNRSRIALNSDFFPDVTDYNAGIVNCFLPYTERDYFFIRSRVFTALGSGIACMIERHPQIQRYFEDGREIILYSSVDEAIARAEHYLSHPDELSAIARRGHEKAARLHTAPVRIRQLLAVMTGPINRVQPVESVLDVPA